MSIDNTIIDCVTKSSWKFR